MKIYGLSISVLIIIFKLNEVASDELIAVVALVRHGARLPESFYPTDPYKNYSWPYVLGDLTNHGIRELFYVGRWIRRNYTPFLSEIYKSSEIYVQSIDYDRCSMSAVSTMAGLYPPVAYEEWHNDLRWQPVPIHITPTWQDIVVDMSICPKTNEIESVIRGTKEYQHIMRRYQDYFNFISQNAGQLINFANMYPLFDTLFSEIKCNLQIPEWAQKIYPQMVPLIVKYTKMNSLLRVQGKIQIGPLLARIVHQFNRALNNKDFGTTKTIYRKFMAYFGTEWILYDLTYSLGLPTIDVPEFAAQYYFELWKNSAGSPYVRILYKNSASLKANAVPVSMKGYPHDIPYDTFVDYVTHFMVNSTQWQVLCQDFVGQYIHIDTNVPAS